MIVLKKYLYYLIPIFTWVLSIVLLIVCVIFNNTISAMNMALSVLIPLVPFVFVIYKLITKEEMPLLLNVLFCIHIGLCVYGGTIFNLYDKIWFYDLILHGYFGFLYSLIIYYFLLRQNNNMSSHFSIFISVFTMLGFAAVWECWEYLCDRITGGDSQKVIESINLGKSPLADTIEDILIAVVGGLIFLILAYIDYHKKHRILKSFVKTKYISDAKK